MRLRGAVYVGWGVWGVDWGGLAEFCGFGGGWGALGVSAGGMYGGWGGSEAGGRIAARPPAPDAAGGVAGAGRLSLILQQYPGRSIFPYRNRSLFI